MRALNLLENLNLGSEYLFRHRRIDSFPFESKENISAYQFNKVKEIVTLAYNHTKFYKQKYFSLDIYPQDIKSWKDFKKLPTITKDDILEYYDQCIVDNRKNDPGLIVSRSSGSSGKILNIVADGHFFIEKALVANRMFRNTMNLQFYDKQLLIYTSEYPYRSLMGAFYKTYYIHNLDPLENIFNYINKVKPALIAAYPSILIDLINQYKDVLKDIPRLKAICTHSEHSSQIQRDMISKFFDCPVFDEYSTEELSKCAYQCQFNNYHLQEDSAYIEVLDTTSNDEVADGSVGEIVGTSFHNTVMPFIRYRQGDLGSVVPSDCKCKRNMRILNNISGRKNDSYKLSNGKIIPSGRILDWTYALILEFKIPILQFKVIQKTYNDIEVIIIPDTSYNPLLEDKIIVKSFKKEFGNLLNVKVIKVKTIPKTPVGKHNAIKSYV